MPSQTPPLVSIVIPVFNGARWLGDAIDSALAQSYLNTEVIVVDDGSNDDGRTRALAEAYGDQIRFISKANGGVASALNAGIESMRGEFFSWLSHDDLYHPRKIEIQLDVARGWMEPVVVFGDVSIIDEMGRKIRDATFTTPSHSRDHAIWHVLEGRLSGCSLLIPRVCFETCGVFDEKLPTTQDYDLWFRLAKKFRFVAAPGYLTLSRMHSTQGSRQSRHLVEAGLSWMGYINELSLDSRKAIAPNEFALARRLVQLPAMQAYPGLASFARRIKAKALASAKITLVINASRCGNLGSPGAVLEEMGYTAIQRVILERHGPRSADSIAVCRFGLRGPYRIAVADDANAVDVAADLARYADPSGIVLFWDDAKFSARARLASMIERTLCGEIEASFDPDAADSFFAGMCVRSSALREAVRRAGRGEPRALLHALMFLGRVSQTSAEASREVVESIETEHSQNTDGVVASEAAGSTGVRDVHAVFVPATQAVTNAVPAVDVTAVQDQATCFVYRPPYLGRFEILRMLRRPFLDEHAVERALERTERLRGWLGGLLYGPRLWYLEKLLGVRGKIDRVWYWRTYPDVGPEIDPVLHYLRTGWREGRDPSPHFSTTEYVARSSASLKINPLSHAVFYGERDPSDLQLGSFWSTRLLRRPLTSVRATEAILLAATALHRTLGPRLSKVPVRTTEWLFGVGGKIDRDWYARTQMGPQEEGMDPSLHYLTTGWRRGLAASPDGVGGMEKPRSTGLAHLNPLSRQTFLGGISKRETLPEALPTSPPGAGIAAQDTALAALPIIPASGSEEISPNTAPKGVSKLLAAELLFVSDGSRVAEEWIRLVQQSVDPQLNFITARLIGDEVILSDGPQERVYNSAQELQSARVYLLERGIRRVDCVGLLQADELRAVVDLLDLPIDVTIVSRMKGQADQGLLDRANRILVADPEIMRGFKHHARFEDVRLVPPPWERERFGFKVSRRLPARGEAFRILTVSHLARDEVARRLQAIAKLIDAGKLPIEVYALQECVGVSSAQSLYWLSDHSRDELIEAVGEADPHLIWFLSHPDEVVAPLLQEVAGMGLPILLTGSAIVARRLFARPFSWAFGDISDEDLVNQIETLRQNGMDLPTTGISPSGMAATQPFYPRVYLDWRSDEE